MMKDAKRVRLNGILALVMALTLLVTSTPLSAISVNDNLGQYASSTLASILFGDDLESYDKSKVYHDGDYVIKDNCLQVYNGSEWRKTSVFQFAIDGKNSLSTALNENKKKI